MCRYCGGIIRHDPRCPEYDDVGDRTGFTCAECGEPILNYEEHAKIKGKAYHTDCLSGMDIVSLIRLMGYEVEGEN